MFASLPCTSPVIHVTRTNIPLFVLSLFVHAGRKSNRVFARELQPPPIAPVLFFLHKRPRLLLSPPPTFSSPIYRSQGAGPSTLLPQLCVEFLPGPTPPTVPVSSEVCSTRSTNNATQILIAHFCAHSGNTLSVYATLFTTELFRSSLPLIYTASTFDTNRVFIDRFDIPYVCSYSYRLSEVSVFDTDEFTLGR